MYTPTPAERTASRTAVGTAGPRRRCAPSLGHSAARGHSWPLRAAARSGSTRRGAPENPRGPQARAVPAERARRAPAASGCRPHYRALAAPRRVSRRASMLASYLCGGARRFAVSASAAAASCRVCRRAPRASSRLRHPARHKPRGRVPALPSSRPRHTRPSSLARPDRVNVAGPLRAARCAPRFGPCALGAARVCHALICRARPRALARLACAGCVPGVRSLPVARLLRSPRGRSLAGSVIGCGAARPLSGRAVPRPSPAPRFVHRAAGRAPGARPVRRIAGAHPRAPPRRRWRRSPRKNHVRDPRRDSCPAGARPRGVRGPAPASHGCDRKNPAKRNPTPSR